MSFAADGFLSPTMDRFRASLKNIAACKAWFEFAEELNRLGLDMLRDRDVPRHDNQRLTIAVLFVRAHKSFQSSLLLAERGLISDARVVLRSAVEGAIALNALANDVTLLDTLIEAHYYNQRKTARLVLDDSIYRAHYSPQQVAEMEATVQDVDARENAVAPRKFRDPNWADVALKHCNDVYQTLYRLLSADGTHTGHTDEEDHWFRRMATIPTKKTTGSDAWRPSVPIDDDRGARVRGGTVGCIC